MIDLSIHNTFTESKKALQHRHVIADALNYKMSNLSTSDEDEATSAGREDYEG